MWCWREERHGEAEGSLTARARPTRGFGKPSLDARARSKRPFHSAMP